MTNRLLALAVLSTGIGAGVALHAQAPATPAPPMPPVLQNYKPVTEERLLHPEDSDVLMVRRTYDGWGYSPLKQITPANVAISLPPMMVVSAHQ